MCSVPGTVPTDFFKVSIYKLELRIFSLNLLLHMSSCFHQMAPPHPSSCLCQEPGVILDTSLFLMTPSHKTLEFLRPSCHFSGAYFASLQRSPPSISPALVHANFASCLELWSHLGSHHATATTLILSTHSPTRRQSNSVTT